MRHLLSIVASLACLTASSAMPGDTSADALPRDMTGAEIEWAAKNQLSPV